MARQLIYAPGETVIDWQLMAFVGRREGCCLVAYPDGRFYSIGFGHNGDDVEQHEVLSESGDIVEAITAAMILFREDLQGMERRIDKKLRVKLNRQQKGAIISAGYNLGATGIASVIDRLNFADNSRDFTPAMDELVKLCRIRKPDDGDDSTPIEYVESAGLLKRRWAERTLFESAPQNPDYGDISKIPYWEGNPYKVDENKKPLFPMKWMPFPVGLQGTA